MPKPKFYIHYPAINNEWHDPNIKSKHSLLKFLQSINRMPADLLEKIIRVYTTAPAGADVAWIIEEDKHSLAFYHQKSNTIFPIPARFL